MFLNFGGGEEQLVVRDMPLASLLASKNNILNIYQCLNQRVYGMGKVSACQPMFSLAGDGVGRHVLSL